MIGRSKLMDLTKADFEIEHVLFIGTSARSLYVVLDKGRIAIGYVDFEEKSINILELINLFDTPPPASTEEK